MRRLLRVLLCVSVAASLCAVTASAASAAAPEFGRCIKKVKAEGSGYSNNGCTTAVGSEAKFEWQPGPGANRKFTSVAREVPTVKAHRCKIWKEAVEAGETERAKKLLEEYGYTEAECVKTLEENETKTPVLLETTEGSKIECLGESATGEYSTTNFKAVENVHVTFTGCEETLLHTACGTGTASSGEITTTTLQGVLGVIKSETNPVNNSIGLRLEAAPGNDVSDFECVGIFGNVSVKVTGSVIHKVNANHMVLTENEKFLQHKGAQKPENFEGSSNEVLYTTKGSEAPVQSGEGLLTELINEEKMEVNSVV
jgi:hypothetical protein